MQIRPLSIGMIVALIGAFLIGLPASGSAHYCSATSSDSDCHGNACPNDGEIHYHSDSKESCLSVPTCLPLPPLPKRCYYLD